MVPRKRPGVVFGGACIACAAAVARPMSAFVAGASLRSELAASSTLSVPGSAVPPAALQGARPSNTPAAWSSVAAASAVVVAAIRAGVGATHQRSRARKRLALAARFQPDEEQQWPPPKQGPLSRSRRPNIRTPEMGLQRVAEPAEKEQPLEYMQPVKQTQAEIVRSQLWDIPKTVLPYQEWRTVKYRNRDGMGNTRDLVGMKGGDYQKMVNKARKHLAKNIPKQARLFRMMRRGRENFGIDIVSEQSKHGMRAFKYRSGMRDLRNDPRRQPRKVDRRLPDRMRKRARWRALLLRRRPSKSANNKQGYVR